MLLPVATKQQDTVGVCVDVPRELHERITDLSIAETRRTKARVSLKDVVLRALEREVKNPSKAG